MNQIDYWKIARRSLYVLLFILVLAIFTKVRMFFLLLEFLGVIIAVFVTGLVAYDLYKANKKSKTPPVQAPVEPEVVAKPKRVRKSKKFTPPQSLN